MSSHVFISHSSKDKQIARMICSALEKRGLTCWIASRDVAPGDDFMSSIVRAIRTAKVMVLVFSENANNSDEIKREVVLAGQHKLLVIPVRVENVVPNDAFAYQFATRQWIDLFEDWEQQIERLSAVVARTVSGEKDAPGRQETVITTPPQDQGPKIKPELHTEAAKPDVFPRALTIVAWFMIAESALRMVFALGRLASVPASSSNALLLLLSVLASAVVVTTAILVLRRRAAARTFGIPACAVAAGYLLLVVGQNLSFGYFGVGLIIPLISIAILAAAILLLIRWRPAS